MCITNVNRHFVYFIVEEALKNDDKRDVKREGYDLNH